MSYLARLWSQLQAQQWLIIGSSRQLHSETLTRESESYQNRLHRQHYLLDVYLLEIPNQYQCRQSHAFEQIQSQSR